MAALDELVNFGTINLAGWVAATPRLSPDCIADIGGGGGSDWQITLEVVANITVGSAVPATFQPALVLASDAAGGLPLHVLGMGPAISASDATDVFRCRPGFAGLRVSFPAPRWPNDYWDGSARRTRTRPGFLFVALVTTSTAVATYTGGSVRVYGSITPPQFAPLQAGRF